MENSSKALLIAGGILIALIILSAFLIMHARLNSFSKRQETLKQQEQIEKFNAQYEAFNKKIMYGVDVITLTNKVNQNNLDHAGDSLYIITLKLNNEVLTQTNNIEHKGMFKCTGMTYNSAGRVSVINIETY